MVSFPAASERVRRRLAAVAVSLAVVGGAALAASFAVGGPAVASQAAAAADALRSYPGYARVRVRSERSFSSVPPRVAVCLERGGGVALSHSTGRWRLVTRPHGTIARALATCR